MFRSDKNLTAVMGPHDACSTLCAVNDTGLTVLKWLDGRHTIEEIARAVEEELGIEHDGRTEAKIAGFVAQVAMVGLLNGPFYARIVERWDVS